MLTLFHIPWPIDYAWSHLHCMSHCITSPVEKALLINLLTGHFTSLRFIILFSHPLRYILTVLSQHSHGWTMKNHKQPQKGKPVTWQCKIIYLPNISLQKCHYINQLHNRIMEKITKISSSTYLIVILAVFLAVYILAESWERDFHSQVWSNEAVAGSQVTMHKALVGKVLHSLRNLTGQLDDLRHWQLWRSGVLVPSTQGPWAIPILTPASSC